MKLEVVKNKRQRRLFVKFREHLYYNDPYYVSTIEFTFKMIFNQKTNFAEECITKPIMVLDNENVVAEAILIKVKKDDFVQIAFFESLENQYEAVSIIKNEARVFAKENYVNRIVVGLYGHLSYGVGLTVDINNPNTFDSVYTKKYYIEYFKEYTKHELCAFSSKLTDLYPYMVYRNSNVTIRPINFFDFKNEMIRFNDICNKTIGKTFLYSKTNPHHFYDLIKELRFFLKKENLLFACCDDEIVGFVFWHPDYNEILSKGRKESIISIGLKYVFNKNKIKRVKLNAIGVLEKYEGTITMNLLNEASKYMKKYDILETNFVWKNNKKSMRINQHLLKNIERNFLVMEEEI